MLRNVFLALVTLGLVLLASFALAPANAATSDFESYTWSYASLGSNQVVCKKVVMHPGKQLQRSSSKEQVVQMSSTSTIVSDRYCANSAKPF
jgi:hypothetical protein